jgi:hypothetical protein
VPGSADRPRTPDQPGSIEAPRELERQDQPAPWSRADLGQRLDRLPFGHPSSTQDSDAPGVDHEPDAAERDYWSEVPRFLRAWEDHLRRWPDAQATAVVDRSRDPEGSWRGDGNQYLSPDQHAQAKDVIARVQQAEESLTKDMTAIQRENTCGGRLAGMQFRLKDEDRLKEKIAEVLKRVPDRSVDDVMRTIPDCIRYTVCFAAANYSDGYREVKQRLVAYGHEMIYAKNHWHENPEYKGINTRWITPEGRQYEVQFHTAESFHAKQQVTHMAYERLRNPLTDDRERDELRALQRDTTSWIIVPEDAADIPDYRKESH